ncbi:PP2C family protein-serine/threonine phosphatase [Kitasatospora sp. NPDC048407]|uniref:PP2C family protein-serine/threonine phosphatase n=1 Tax=Kitasatospora sp. NPDC048407 TaxID=3364051 RepID=UPI0037213AB4
MVVPIIAVSVLSHTGVVRQHNEDSVAVGPWTLCATATDSPQTFYFPLGATALTVAVADGLGGHPGGDLASSLIAGQLASTGGGLTDEQAVRDALQAGHETLHDAADADPALTGMSTTVAGLALTAESVFVFNVGDSRVYELTDTEPELLTTDDSPPLAEGQRTTHLVTSVLGGATPRDALAPHVTRLPVRPGARYLLCTDGLSDPVPPEEWMALITDGDADEDDQHAVVELWRAAIRAGGPDNITLALVRIDD